MILEKFGKKKYQIWSFNQVEKPITDFNSGLKKKANYASVLHPRGLLLDK